MLDLAKKYILGITAGEITAGRKARLAVERHISDLEQARKKGWHFDETEAEIALTFISFLRHTKGEWAKKPFQLQPHQAFIIYCLFGWRISDTGARRFRKAYIRMARKGGKSELAAAIAAYMLIADGEPGAEVYTAATTRDQARKVFDPTAAMCRMLKNEDPDLRKALKVFDSKNNCLIKLDDGEIPAVCQPLSQDYDVAEGSNPSFASLDEFHLHKTTGMLDMIETGMGARSQPLLLIITTAGFDLSSPCYEYEKTAVRILTGDAVGATTFVMIFDLDDEDDWTDEKNWPKANPGLPYNTPRIVSLRTGLENARAEGYTSERAFRVKNLNEWMTSTTGWIPDEDWKRAKCPFALEEMKGRTAFGGLDFASIRDLNSFCLLFPPAEEGEKFRLRWRIYCPAAAIDDPKRNEGKATYKAWERQGHLIRTDGNAADFQYLCRDILDQTAGLDIEVMGYDAKFALTPTTILQDEGIKMEPVPQNYGGLTVPILQVELLAINGLLEIEPNPVIDWMMNNVALVMGDGDLVRISKQRSAGKIDGIAAMLDAFHVYLKSVGEGEQVTITDLIAAKLLVK